MEILYKEEWRDVVGYEGLYEVSDLGNVRKVGKKLYHLGRFNTEIEAKNVYEKFKKGLNEKV